MPPFRLKPQSETSRHFSTHLEQRVEPWNGGIPPILPWPLHCGNAAKHLQQPPFQVLTVYQSNAHRFGGPWLSALQEGVAKAQANFVVWG